MINNETFKIMIGGIHSYHAIVDEDIVVINDIKIIKSFNMVLMTNIYNLIINDIEVYFNYWLDIIGFSDECREKVINSIVDEYKRINNITTTDNRKHALHEWCKNH